MNVDEILRRARSQSKLQAVYRLGGGTSDVEAQTCLDRFNSCDCSAFVRWVLKIQAKEQVELLRKVNGGWYNTDGMWWDAVNLPGQGIFDLCDPQEGAIIVYPARWVSKANEGPQIGHVGIISQVKNGSILKAIHCSQGNFKNYADAIMETGVSIWSRVDSTKYAMLRR